MNQIVRIVGVVLGLVGLTFSMTGQELRQTIKGVVTDQAGEFPLIGVNIILDGDPGLGVATDLDGNFSFQDVLVGRHSLQLSYLGYEDVVIGNVLLTSGKELFLDVEMEEAINALEEVVIKADADKHKALNEMATVSARTMNVEEMSRYAGNIADPARMAQNFAGVSGASDDRNDIIVRGNSPTGVLWRMEGIDIPSPNHFSSVGTTGGPVSMLNINNLRSSDFLTSAFPAEYGNATSSVFDLKLRNGNYDKYEFLGQIGFNGFEGGVEGPLPFGKNASFLVNYRYSTLSIFNALGFDLGLGSAIPQYQDVTAKINIPTEQAGRFSLWAVAGKSYIEFKPDTLNQSNLYTDYNEQSEFGSNTAFGGLTHTYFFNDHTSSKVDLSFAGYDNDANTDTLTTEGIPIRLFQRDFTQVRYGLDWRINHKVSPQHRILSGVGHKIHAFDARDQTSDENGELFTFIRIDDQLHISNAFASWQYRPSTAMTINGGVHFLYLHFNDDVAVDPRLGLSYDISEKGSFSVGLGIHSQMQPLPIYFREEEDANGNAIQPNTGLTFFRNFHSVIGYDYLINSHARLKAEVYFQHLYDIAIDETPSTFSMINTGADFGFPSRSGLENAGVGRNYGFELTLEKYLNQRYYYLLTASIFDSKYRGSDEVWRNTLFNSNYVFNALGGKEFALSDALALTLDTKVTYTGGQRYVPIDLEASKIEGNEVYLTDLSYEDRYEDYFRWDVKLGIRHNAKKFSQSFSVDFQNLTNKQNIFTRQYNGATNSIETVYQRGFFPDVRYQVVF